MTTPSNVSLESFAIGKAAASGDENLHHAEPTDPHLIHSQVNPTTAGEHICPDIAIIISHHVVGLRSGNQNMNMANDLGREELGQEKNAERDYTLLGAFVKYLTCFLPLGSIAIFCAANFGGSGYRVAFRVSSILLAIVGLIVGVVALYVSRITSVRVARPPDGNYFKVWGWTAIAGVVCALATTALSIKVLIYQDLLAWVTCWDWAAFCIGLVNVFIALLLVAIHYMSHLRPLPTASKSSLFFYSILPIVCMVIPHLNFNVFFGGTL